MLMTEDALQWISYVVDTSEKLEADRRLTSAELDGLPTEPQARAVRQADSTASPGR